MVVKSKLNCLFMNLPLSKFGFLPVMFLSSFHTCVFLTIVDHYISFKTLKMSLIIIPKKIKTEYNSELTLGLLHPFLILCFLS